MSEKNEDWSCYTTAPAESLELFEEVRSRCPIPHSKEHEGFFMLLNYTDVRSAMMDYRTFSSEPQVLRPMLPRKCIPALEIDPQRHTAWRAIFNQAITPKTAPAMEEFVRAHVDWSFESSWYGDYVHNRGTRSNPVNKGDASLTYDATKWSVGLWVKNIQNKVRIAATAAAGIPGPATSYLDPPRTYGLRAAVNY